MDGLKVQLVLLQGPRNIIFNEYVTFLGEFVQDVDTRRILEGQSQGLLIPIHLGAVSHRCSSLIGSQVLTPRKYADSPRPSHFESGLYLAYGGPHARVSSPRTGCSILMTSALRTVSARSAKPILSYEFH